MGESSVFGDAAGGRAEAAGLSALVADVDGLAAEKPGAAHDDASGVQGADPPTGRCDVTIFAVVWDGCRRGVGFDAAVVAGGAPGSGAAGW